MGNIFEHQRSVLHQHMTLSDPPAPTRGLVQQRG